MSDAVALGAAGSPRLPGRALRALKDEKLAAMVTAGSDDAFATLYGRHHQAIYRYCLGLLRQDADARDALQSSMLAALSSLRASPIEGAFKPWLFRIAHNQSISIIRGRAREAPTEAAAEAASGDDVGTREELRTLVSDLTALPERQRGAIVMRELSGLSYAEIGAVLSTSEAGGKQLVYEARTAMHELREGHEMSCDLVRERISAGDRRLLRGRKVRSHLRGCQPCQDFERGIGRRRAAFAALAPPLPALAAAAVLQDVFGSGGASGGVGAGGTAASAVGGGASGSSLAGATALKFTAVALLAGAAGVGAYHAGTAIFGNPPASTSAALANDRDVRAGGSRHAERGASDRGGKGGAGARAKTDADSGGSRSRSSKSASSKPVAATHASAAGSTPSSAADGTTATNSGGTTGSGDTTGGGTTGGGGGGGGGAVDPPPAPDPPPPPGGGGGSGAAPGTPPGHGGTPPGQGGIPPGQAGGETPPGHLDNPGHGGG
jgi:RNA polymerase sigma factor (sigma-70 family)